MNKFFLKKEGQTVVSPLIIRTRTVTPILFVYEMMQSPVLVYERLREFIGDMRGDVKSLSSPSLFIACLGLDEEVQNMIRDKTEQELFTDAITSCLKEFRYYQNRKLHYLGVYVGRGPRDFSEFTRTDFENLFKNEGDNSDSIYVNFRLRIKNGRLPTLEVLADLLNSRIAKSDTLTLSAINPYSSHHEAGLTSSVDPYSFCTISEFRNILEFICENFTTPSQRRGIRDLTPVLTDQDALLFLEYAKTFRWSS